MRGCMLVNPSGLPGHWMAIDMNIEHLIGYLKVSLFLYIILCYSNAIVISHSRFIAPRGSTPAGKHLATFRRQLITCKRSRSKSGQLFADTKAKHILHQIRPIWFGRLQIMPRSSSSFRFSYAEDATQILTQNQSQIYWTKAKRNFAPVHSRRSTRNF